MTATTTTPRPCTDCVNVHGEPPAADAGEA